MQEGGRRYAINRVSTSTLLHFYFFQDLQFKLLGNKILCTFYTGQF